MSNKRTNEVSQYEKMTETPVSRLVLRLAIPSIITMLVSNIYNLVDTAFVGRLGTSASAAVGVVFGFMAIIQAFSFMFGQGAGSILARALGIKDKETASVNASAGFFGAMFCGLVITVVGFVWLDPVVRLLGSTETIAPYARVYIAYILVASPFMSGSLALNNILRYEGKASLGMIGLMTGAILNMIGDPILMFGLKMGIAGAGLSTAISQIVSWAILLYMFFAGKTESKLSFSKAIHAAPAVYANICLTGLPSLLRQGLNSVTTVLLNAQCAIYGDAAVAGMSIVTRIIFFAFSIALGIGQGYQPVSAYNYGAKKYSRIKKGFWFTTFAAEIILAVSCVLMVTFAEPLIALFLTMICCIILGMGVPTTATYIIMATTCAPILTTGMGLNSICANMFVFYFGIVADITPPVALAAYAGSAIAKSNPMKTALNASKLAIAAFLIPYIFCLNPQMLLIDTTVIGFIVIVVTSFIGMIAIAAAIEGYMFTTLNPVFRILLAAAGLALIYPGWLTDVIGVAVVVIIGAIVMLQKKHREAA